MPDVRSRRGIRHPLSAMLAQACCAMLCEARRDSAIAAWGRHDGAHIGRALGFRHPPPCAATLHAQQAVAEKTNEITAVETVLSQLVLTGRVVTMDALLPQTAVAQTIVDAGGDDVMVVKAHQPQLRADMALIFAEPPVGDPQETADTIARGHGRIEQRRFTTSQPLAGHRAWPGLAQVFAWERSVIIPNTGAVRTETVYGGTSLASHQATPARLLALGRGHWQIEHQAHGVREVTCDEDHSQVRCGHMPQVMAALRHTTIGLLRQADYANIAAACRRLAAQPTRALALIGSQLEN